MPWKGEEGLLEGKGMEERRGREEREGKGTKKNEGGANRGKEIGEKGRGVVVVCRRKKYGMILKNIFVSCI